MSLWRVRSHGPLLTSERPGPEHRDRLPGSPDLTLTSSGCGRATPEGASTPGGGRTVRQPCCAENVVISAAPAMFLRSLHPIPEEDFETASSILPSHHSPFSRLHSSDKHMQVAKITSDQGPSEVRPAPCRKNSPMVPPYCNVFMCRYGTVLALVVRRSRNNWFPPPRPVAVGPHRTRGSRPPPPPIAAAIMTPTPVVAAAFRTPPPPLPATRTPPHPPPAATRTLSLLTTVAYLTGWWRHQSRPLPLQTTPLPLQSSGLGRWIPESEPFFNTIGTSLW